MKKIKFIILLLLSGIIASCHYEDDSKYGAYSDLIPGKQGVPHKHDKKFDKVYGHGIDLSHHNAEPDWNKLDIDFVIMKATEGTDYIDPTFIPRLVKCKENNIPVGAYHFFTGRKDGEKEFNNFYRIAADFIDIIPVVDAEKIPKGVTKKDYLGNLRVFLDRTKEVYGMFPIIYTSEEFYYSTLKHMLDTHYSMNESINPVLPNKIWFGNIGVPYNKYSICPVMNQISIKPVKGIEGKVDFNELHVPIEEILLSYSSL